MRSCIAVAASPHARCIIGVATFYRQAPPMAAFEEPALALQLSRAERGRQERGEARDNALAQRRRRVDHRRRADDRGRLRRSRLRRALALSWLPVLAAWRSNAAAVRSSTAASAPASASTSALASSPASSCSAGAAATVGGKRGWSAVYQTAKQIREANTRSRVGAQGARCIELEKINSVELTPKRADSESERCE